MKDKLFWHLFVHDRGINTADKIENLPTWNDIIVDLCSNICCNYPYLVRVVKIPNPVSYLISTECEYIP